MKADNQNNKVTEMGFLEHLEVLRWHIIKYLIAILVFGVVAFIYKDFVFDTILLSPKTPKFITNELLCKAAKYFNAPLLCINSKPFQIINISMSGQFSTHIMVSFICGIIVAFPYFFWEIWRFIKPALHKNEKRYARGAVFYTSMQFILGVLFGYYIIIPLTVDFFGGYNVSAQVVNQFNLTSYISTISSTVLASGIVFELPVIIYFLSRVGVVTPSFLKSYRRHAVVVILILAAIITPPDVFSQLLVSLPLYLLYEISITISKRVTLKYNKPIE